MSAWSPPPPAFLDAAGGGDGGSPSVGGVSSVAEAQRRLLALARELEQAKTAAQRKKCLTHVVDLLRNDAPRLRLALDAASAASSFDPALVDWSALLALALQAVTGVDAGGFAAGAGAASSAKKARSSGPTADLWQQLQFLFEQSERSGRHLTQPLIDACLAEVRALLHVDAAGDAGASSGADPVKIQAAIPSLAAIMQIIFAFPPYAHCVKQEHMHDLFSLFSDSLLTLSRLTPTELGYPLEKLAPLVRTPAVAARFPASFLGLYRSPAAAVDVLVALLSTYPFAQASATGAALARTFLAQHVYPLLLSFFSLRLADPLLMRLLGALVGALERTAAWAALDQFRECSYAFLYNMLAPGAWPKSPAVKNELVRFALLALRVSHTLPPSNPLRIVEELDAAHPLYRLLYRELDADVLYSMAGVPDLQLHDQLALDAPTHAFLSLCAGVFAHVLAKPEAPRNSADGADNEAMDAAAAAALVAGSSDGAAAAAAPSSSRKKRRLESDAAFAPSAIWSNYAAGSGAGASGVGGLPSGRLVNWLKFLFVFTQQYPAFFALHAGNKGGANAGGTSLLAQLLYSLLCSSERTKADVKLWSLACLSRLASVCHLHGLSFASGGSPSPALLQSYPSPVRADVSKAYCDLAGLFGQTVDLLLRKHLFDERRMIARSALSLLTKLACYGLVGPAQMGVLHTVLAELPALKAAAAPLGGHGRLSSQLLIKKEPLSSPQQPLLRGGGGSGVKLEHGLAGASFGAAGGFSASTPLQALLSSECDLVTLRFLVAYLQRFDLADSVAAGAAAGSSSQATPALAFASAMGASPIGGARARPAAYALDVLGEEQLLRWVLGFRLGSSLFNPSTHSLRAQWSTTNWHCVLVLALNKLPVSDGNSAVCLEDDSSDEVRLPAVPSRFVSAPRPSHSWLKADMGAAVDVHDPAALKDYCQEVQFAALVSNDTKDEEVRLHQLPSVNCRQHAHISIAVGSSGVPAALPSASASLSRSSFLRALTVEVLAEQVAALQRVLLDKAGAAPSVRNSIEMDTTDHRSSFSVAAALEDEDGPMADERKGGSSARPAVLSSLRIEDTHSALRFYLHYAHILLALLQRDQQAQNSSEREPLRAVSGSQEGRSGNESRSAMLDLLSSCLLQLALLLPNLISFRALDCAASANLLGYLTHLLSCFGGEMLVASASSPRSRNGAHGNSSSATEQQAHPALTQALVTIQAALLKLLLHGVKSSSSTSKRKGDASRRSLGFDDVAPVSSSASSSSSSHSYLATELHSSDAQSSAVRPPPVLNSLLDCLTRLLTWRVLPPVNLLADLKTLLDNHMGLRSSVRALPSFYRLAHLHALSKSMARTPQPNQDLLYYLSFLAEEMTTRPPEGSAVLTLSRDELHYRALAFFLELAQSVQAGCISLDSKGETERVHKVWSGVFGAMQGKAGASLHRLCRLLKARCGYAGVMSGLTNNWLLVSQLALDLVTPDFVLRLFATTQVRMALTIPEAAAQIYNTFEERVLKALREEPKGVSAAAGPIVKSAAGGTGAAGDAADKREAFIMTLLACLARMGLSVPSKERTILLHLCRLWRERPLARPVVALVYAQFSACLHYASRGSAAASSSSAQSALLRASASSLFPSSAAGGAAQGAPQQTSLLDDHLDFVLGDWLANKMDLGAFPRELLVLQPAGAGVLSFSSAMGSAGSSAGSSYSLDSFLRGYASRIAPLLILHHDTLAGALQLLCDALGMDVSALVKKYFPLCCARFYALYSQNTASAGAVAAAAEQGGADMVSFYINAATACLEFFKKSMTEKKFNTYYHSKMNEMLCALVDLVLLDPSGPKLASYQLSNLLVSLGQLAKADKLSIPQHLCSPAQDRIQTLLLYLRVRIASEFRAFRQWKLVEVLRALLTETCTNGVVTPSCLGEFLCAPAVWRPVMDLLLWLLPEFDARFPEHAEEGVRLLAAVTLEFIKQVAAAPPSATTPTRAGTTGRAKEGVVPSAADAAAAASAAAASAAICTTACVPPAEMVLHVRHIIIAMVDYSGAASAPANEESGGEAPKAGTRSSKIALVAQLVLDLINALPAHLHGELSLLPPFPSHPLFAKLNERFASLSAASTPRSLAEEIIAFLLNVRTSASPKEGAAGLPHLLAQLRSRQKELNQLLQPVPPSLSALGLEVLTLPEARGGKRANSGGAAVAGHLASVKNAIIAVDGRNPGAAGGHALDDAAADLSVSMRVSNRILSSPDHETSGHYGFDLVAPLIGTLCAFCSWSQADEATAAKNLAMHATGTGSVNIRASLTSAAARIRMLAAECLGEIGAVDPFALNGHNARIFRCANPLPPIGRPMPAGSDAPHPFASALLSAANASPSSSASAAAQLHAAWYGRWYAVGGGLQASSCENRDLKKEPQAYVNHPHHVLILHLLSQAMRSSNAHVAQLAAHALSNLFLEQKEMPPVAASSKGGASEAKSDDAALHPPSSHRVMTAAYAQLDPMTQAYLAPFCLAKLKTFRALIRARTREEPEADVWDPAARSYDDWLCRLMRFLLSRRVRDPVLIHCAGLVQHLPEFAERLLPYALFDILAQGDPAMQQGLAMRINTLIGSVLASAQQAGGGAPAAGSSQAATSSPIGGKTASVSPSARSVLLVVLSALQFAREQMLMIHRQPLIPVAKGHPPSASAREGMELVRLLETHWNGRLDFLRMARAALSVGMHASSLLWLEAWHERTYGRITTTSAQDAAEFQDSLVARALERAEAVALGQASQSTMSDSVASSSTTRADDRAEYQRLLLEVSRLGAGSSDSDMVNGVLHSRDQLMDVDGAAAGDNDDDMITSEIIVSEHEGNYAKTIQLYDSLFQRARRAAPGEDAVALRTPAAAGAGLVTFAPKPSLSAAHAGLVRSLQQLGCTHLLDRYMSDLSSQDGAAYSAIQDAHYEAAWRTANWDLETRSVGASAAASTGMSDAAERAGIQTCLFHSLRSLHDLTLHHKNRSAFVSSLSAARGKLVESLSNAGPETSASHVFPSIVKLHLLADVQRAWGILDTAATAANSMDVTEQVAGAAAALRNVLASAADSGARFEQFEHVGRERLFLLASVFDQVEPLLALRGVILELAAQPTVLASHLRFVASFARQSNRRVVGAHAIREGTGNPSIPLVCRLSLQLEAAQLSWSEGLADTAIRTAKQVVAALNSLLALGSASAAATGGLDTHTNQETCRLLIDASCLVAEWMSRSHSEASHVIQQFLTSAASVAAGPSLPAGAQSAQRCKVHCQLGLFFDRTFQGLIAKSQTPEHEASRRLYHSNADKIRKLNLSMSDPAVQAVLRNRDSSDDKILAARQVYQTKLGYIRRLEKEHAVDTLHIQQFDKSLAHALEQAFVNFAHCLRLGDAYDTQVVYRLIALWFNNYADSPFTAEKLHNVKLIDSIPSRKFLPLVYQVASRLSSPDVPGISQEQKHFRQAIHDLLKRMVLDHPFHSLHQVFALAHGDQVARVSMSVAGGAEMNEARIRAAGSLLSELKKTSAVKDLVVAQEKLIKAYIELGSHKFARGIDHVQFAATPLATLRQRDLALVPVPTLTIPVRADCNYSTLSPRDGVVSRTGSGGGGGSGGSGSLDSPIVTIATFDSRIHMATSGVNVPLILEMLCSDGARHKQLLKSADDLRQDCVLEQLFKVVNELLQGNRSTAARQLHIRTYNVVPLTPGIGMVEWVTGTVSLAECLVTDRTGAHARHPRPGQQRDYRQILHYLREAHEARNPDEFAARFRAVCADFPPVFHRWFLEQFPAPSEWLARRTAYTRSVAVSSIVGFVVGLGDRHIHNILLDVRSCELVHIDLGVAFDAGLVLKTPEIVPFRLTRDLVDAMGVTGVEGPFRRAAEESMRVMREARHSLLTVLEVFLHDPLYKWALSPAKIQQLRPLSEDDEAAALSGAAPAAGVAADSEEAAGGGGASAAGNSGAARAMFNVRQRLAGAGGTAQRDTLSVEGQVNALIHEATDMERLAKMYYGWSAFV